MTQDRYDFTIKYKRLGMNATYVKEILDLYKGSEITVDLHWNNITDLECEELAKLPESMINNVFIKRLLNHCYTYYDVQVYFNIATMDDVEFYHFVSDIEKLWTNEFLNI